MVVVMMITLLMTMMGMVMSVMSVIVDPVLFSRGNRHHIHSLCRIAAKSEGGGP